MEKKFVHSLPLVLSSILMIISVPGCISSRDATIPTPASYDAQYIDYDIPSTMNARQLYNINLTIKNVGSLTWETDENLNPVHLSYHWLDSNGKITVFDGLRTPLSDNVPQGVTIYLNAQILAPYSPGNYTLVIDMVREGVTWFQDEGDIPLKQEINVEIGPLTLPVKNTTYSTSNKHFSSLKGLIYNTLFSAATSFEGKSGRIYGFYAGKEYPQIWIRDSATVIPVARYSYADPFLRTWIEEHLYHQTSDGSLYDFITSSGFVDKNTVETDQEPSLVHAAYQYYKITGNKTWLIQNINGMPLINRLENSLRYILHDRYNEEYGMVIGAHTADWGDVQFEDSPGVDITENTHWTCDIYDNAMFHIAAVELSDMYLDLEDQNKSFFWKEQAESIKINTNKQLWQEDKGFYKVHVHVTKLAHDFDENDIFPLGGNAIAIRSGLASPEQKRKIFEAAKKSQILCNASTIGVMLCPSYPDGFFSNSIMDQAYEYQNGGQWDWFSARLIKAEFENGYVDEAYSHLDAIARKDIKNNGLYEWDTLEGRGQGSVSYVGSAGVLGEVLYEGYFGVYLSKNNLTLQPRLGRDNGSIYLFEPPTGTYIGYNYSYENTTITVHYRSNFPKNGSLKILVPENETPSNLYIDGIEKLFYIEKVGSDNYIVTNTDFKQHTLRIILN